MSIKRDKNKDDAQEQLLWQKYRKRPTPANRELLIKNYLWLVRYICGRIAVELPARIKTDDLINSGVLGLIDAIEKYDETHNNLFKTYAFSRVRGAIIDELRRLDWAPRLVRRKAREIERVSQELEMKYNRKPTLEEIAREAGMSAAEVSGVLQDLHATSLLSLEEALFPVGDAERSPTLLETVEDTRSINPKKFLEQRELKEQLARAIQQLPEKQQLVLTLYYYEELTLKEIGRVLEVSESRVCQIHAQAIGSVQAILQEENSLPDDNFANFSSEPTVR